MIKSLLIVHVLGLCFLETFTNAMFFTNSKENDYPRIGKRKMSLLNKLYKTWERDSNFDAPDFKRRIVDDIGELLNFHGSAGTFRLTPYTYNHTTSNLQLYSYETS